MSALGAALVLVLLAAMALWIVAPMRQPLRQATFAGDAHWQELVEKKHALYRNILDLEYDLAIGRVAHADYAVLRRQHEVEALAVLSEMETMSAGGEPSEVDLDTLEAEIAAARQRLRPRT